MKDPGISIATLFYDGASRNPSATAVDDSRNQLTYETLVGRVEACAAALQSRLPDANGRIALCAENHIEHLVAYLAILLSGRVWIPLNPRNGPVLNSNILGRAAADIVLVDRKSVGQVPEQGNILYLDDLPSTGGSYTRTARAADDVAAIKFTGGTSGQPKGVLQTHGNMLAVIENMQAFYEFTDADCNLAVAPLTHGSSHYILPIIAAGGRHRFPLDNSASSIVSALRDGTTVSFVPPTVIYKILDGAALSPEEFPRLRHLSYSAAPMPPSRIREAQEAFGPCISTVYGQTEAPNTICGLTADEMKSGELQGTVGRACRNCQIRVVDDTGEAVAIGETGVVEVSSPIVMKGYLDDSELTQKTIRNGWLSTGDIGWLDDAGYLTLVGRGSEMIISGGFNVYPAEVENVLTQAPGVIECCVFAVADDYWGERIEAILVVENDAEKNTPQLLAFVREQLGPVRTPKALHFSDAIPRNAVGKVIRRDMPEFVRSQGS